MYKQHAQSAPSTALADACSTPQLPQPDLAGAGERFGGGSTALQVLGLHLASTEVSFPVLSPDFFFSSLLLLMHDFYFSWLPRSSSLVSCKYQDAGEGRHGSQGFLHAKSDVFRAKLDVAKRRGGKRCCLSSAAKFWVFL